jgi:hypothetical protein
MEDDIQFDDSLEHTKKNKQLRELFGTTYAVHIEDHPPRPRRKVPAWTISDHALVAHMIKPVARNTEIARLFWRANWTSQDIAEKLDMTKNAVEMVIKKLREEE